MKITEVSLIIFSLISINLSGQNLIGYSEPEIRKYMTENKKNMSFQNFINNNTFKYLKYSDNLETETLLFFLTEKLICKSVRRICDKSLKTRIIDEYDRFCKKTGEGQWMEIKNGTKYIIELKDEEYTFYITIKLNE
jgi:hypothetical protein